MSADGKIYIIITNRLPNGMSPNPEEDENQGGEGNSGQSLFSHWAKQRLINEAKSLATNSVMHTLHNIGNFTGDYMTQSHVNSALSAINGLIDIGTAAIAGAKFGPAGAAIGAAIAIVNKGVSSGYALYQGYLENQRTNYEIRQLRDRSGMNALLDGSRGTED